MANEEEQNEKKCPSCSITAGMTILFSVAENAEIEHKDVKEQLEEGKIDVQEAFNTVKERLKQKDDKFSLELVEEAESIVRKDVAEEENQQQNAEQPSCVSVIIKVQTLEHIDKMIENRQAVLNEMTGKANDEFIQGTSKLLENLKSSKQMIEELPTCEEENQQ